MIEQEGKSEGVLWAPVSQRLSVNKKFANTKKTNKRQIGDALLEPQWHCWTIILTYKGRMKESQEKLKDGEKTITQGIFSIKFSIEGQPERRKLEKKRERIGKRK